MRMDKLKIGDKVVFTMDIHTHFGTIVGFTPAKVKIKRYGDEYINTIYPNRVDVITDKEREFIGGE